MVQEEQSPARSKMGFDNDSGHSTTKALTELRSLDQKDVAAVRQWWRRWYPSLGHRRLGKLLLKYPNLREELEQARRTLPSTVTGQHLTEEEKDVLTAHAAGHLSTYSSYQVLPVARWWASHFLGLGNTRLGRLLVDSVILNTSTQGTLPRPHSVEPRSTQLPLLQGSDCTNATNDNNRQAPRHDNNCLPCHFVSKDIDDSSFFNVKPNGSSISIALNSSHPAYSAFQFLISDASTDDPKLAILRDLLISWAQYEFQQPTTLLKKTKQARQEWGRALRDLIQQ